MSLKPEERVKRWVLDRPTGHTFHSSDISKKTGIPAKFITTILLEMIEKAEKEGKGRIVKHTNPDEKKAVFVWERI